MRGDVCQAFIPALSILSCSQHITVFMLMVIRVHFTTLFSPSVKIALSNPRVGSDATLRFVTAVYDKPSA
jgi:hypothetical protein